MVTWPYLLLPSYRMASSNVSLCKFFVRTQKLFYLVCLQFRLLSYMKRKINQGALDHDFVFTNSIKWFDFYNICLYRYICPLEFDTEYVIDGIKVIFIDANHCPGAALIHFELPNGQCYLHTGDFRACKLMQDYHLFVNKRVNILYLDTTYCNPKYK
jgi:hypothetical protein